MKFCEWLDSQPPLYLGVPASDLDERRAQVEALAPLLITALGARGVGVA